MAVPLLGAILLLMLGDAPTASLTTNTRSESIPSAAGRLDFLGRYLKMRTPARDAVFHVVFHDNSGLVPGPSDWSIVAAVQVTPADGPRWLEAAVPASLADAQGPLSGYARLPLPPEWHVQTAGEFYNRQGTWLVWHPEGVIEVSMATH